MRTSKFNEWLGESDETDSIFNEDNAKRIHDDVAFISKFSKRSKIQNHNQIDPASITVNKSTPGYDIRLSFTGNLYKAIEKLLNVTDFDVVPDMVSNFIRIKIELDESLQPGESKILDIHDWKDRHTLKVQANPKDYDQLKKVVGKSLTHLFDKFKKVRYVMPRDLKVIQGFSERIKDNVKSLYDNIIDDFYEDGSLERDLVDNDILAEIFIKTLLQNPEYIGKVDAMSKPAKKKIFKGALEVFKNNEDLKIDSETLAIMKSYFKARSVWSLI
jgi:hypothetical protein